MNFLCHIKTCIIFILMLYYPYMKKQFNFVLDDKLKDRMLVIAKRRKRSLAFLINEFCEKETEIVEKRQEAIERNEKNIKEPGVVELEPEDIGL